MALLDKAIHALCAARSYIEQPAGYRARTLVLLEIEVVLTGLEKEARPVWSDVDDMDAVDAILTAPEPDKTIVGCGCSVCQPKGKKS